MRALVLHGPGNLEVTRVPEPVPEPGEVLISVRAAGICGTDRHIVAGDLPVPPGTIPGHEVAGVIVKGVGEWEPGRRVLSYGQVVCGECRSCRDGASHRCRRPQVLGMSRPGGFAEAIAVPASLLVAVPDKVPDEIAAVTPDALATPYHALVAVGRITAGEAVVIVGTGGVGLQAVALAKHLGAGTIVAVDPSAPARQAALAAGADHAVDPADGDAPKAIHAATGGADLALECVGRAESVELAMGTLAPGGRLVVVGVGHDRPRLPPLLRFVAGEYAVLGSFGSTITEIEHLLATMASGGLDVPHAVSRTVDLDDAPAVFREPPTPGRTVIRIPE